MHLRQGSIKGLDPDAGVRGIILGSTLAEQTGLMIGSPATVISYQGELTPFGTVPSAFRFKVAGIFESGIGPNRFRLGLCQLAGSPARARSQRCGEHY